MHVPFSSECRFVEQEIKLNKLYIFFQKCYIYNNVSTRVYSSISDVILLLCIIAKCYNAPVHKSIIMCIFFQATEKKNGINCK